MDVGRFSRHLAQLAAAGVMIAAIAGPARVWAEAAPQSCMVPSDLVRFDFPLSRLAERIANAGPIKIVAIGSSSTSGHGASSSAFCYPSRLEIELKARFPRLAITVINHGVGGEEASQMLARFGPDAIAENPDLVLWQVGTNAVLRGRDVAEVADTIREGINRLKAIGTDVILIGPQFAPRVIEKSDAENMVALITAAAKREKVNVFRRFAVMRYWSETRHVSFQQSVSPDGLHMNDWSYGCMAQLLANAIADASAHISHAAGIPGAASAHR